MYPAFFGQKYNSEYMITRLKHFQNKRSGIPVKKMHIGSNKYVSKYHIYEMQTSCDKVIKRHAG